MHRSEAREGVACAACGTVVDLVGGNAYAYGSESALCFDCAVERGGRFDAQQDRWVEAPGLADLAREDD
jgi:hypothetical protein